ncbi:uncharacterized protein METZ01_LOCUS50439 [marine metagenome]|uniref:Uncharacterized protein n=1 Tax=marine metagenome TaxID=408172 RepID=A0A381S0E8_9ZZZZ
MIFPSLENYKKHTPVGLKQIQADIL